MPGFGALIGLFMTVGT